MQIHNAKPLIKGLIKNILLPKFLINKTVGGGATIDSLYCYSVWMRHLIKWGSHRSFIPDRVAELGPGKSLGISFAALLTGSKKVYAFDILKYWNNEENLRIFDELVQLFKNRAKVPSDSKYARITPRINEFSFPFHVVSEEQLKKSLAPDRIAKIRHEIMNIENCDNEFIEFQIAWHDSNILEENSVDFIFSQAVLQHVSDLDRNYKAMKNWLKPNGLMSHSIDFKCFGTSTQWNGHWCYGEKEWKIVCGDYYLINRHPLSKHLSLHFDYGFKVLEKDLDYLDNNLKKRQLSEKYKQLTIEDLTTSGMYILSEKE